MKILYITNYPAPYAVDFFNELGRGCALTVMFLEDSAYVTERENSWFKTEVNNFKAIFIGNKSRKKISFRAARLVKGYDLVLVGEYSSFSEMYIISYMRRKKIRYAFSIDGGIKKSGKGLKEALKRYLLKGAPLYLSSGRATDEYLVFYGAAEENIRRYTFTSLSEEDILSRPPSMEEKFALRQKTGMKEEKIIVSVGQFIYRKGFDVLMRAAAEIGGGVGVYIIGGKPTEEYTALKASLKVEGVHFVGFKSKEELKEYYMAADLFVLPTREDIWGLVVNEAMACALPVITTSGCVAGLELIKDGVNGYIVPVDDFNAIAKKASAILSDGALAQKMAEENLNKIRGYTVKNMAAGHLAAIEELLKK